MKYRHYAVTFVFLALTTGSALGAAARAARPDDGQTPPAGARASQSPSTEAAEVAKAIESARASRTAGQFGDALKTMVAVLKKYPANTEAARFQIGTLVEQERIADALVSYDVYAVARKRPDAVALSTVARADLLRTLRTKRDQPTLVAKALERLARDGDQEALRSLRQMSAGAWVSPDGLAPATSLARLGDPAGVAKLESLINAPQPLERAQVIQAIGEAGVRSLVPAVLGFLSDPDANVRIKAATTLGVLQDRQAIPKLKTMFETDTAAARMFAAIALKQLGDTSADAFLDGLLSGQIAELRVFAADAYRFATSKSPQWDKAVRTLMGGPNEEHRLRAAELLACCDVIAARGFLTSALASPNPFMRAGAAKIYEAQKQLADAVAARRILGDAMEAVRVHGAGLSLAIARSEAASPARGRGGR